MNPQNILFITGFLILIFMGWPLIFRGAPLLPSFRKDSDVNFKKLFEVLNNENVEKVIDLGSGDGRLVKKLSQAGFSVVGIEINPLLVWWSRKKLNKNNVNIKWGNMWNQNLSKFDAVFIFHFLNKDRKLTDKFKKELKDGALIVSTGFNFDSFELIEKISPYKIYKYKREK